MKCRIATIKVGPNSGDSFVVQQIDDRSSRVHVWGDLVKWKYSKRTGAILKQQHESGFALPLADVDITEVERDVELLNRLWEQALQHLRDKGKIITGKKRVRVYDSPDAKLRADMVRAESRMFRQAIRNGTGVEALLNSLVLGGRRG